MYSTCVFCAKSLGHNETLEHFPVGRRIAFDPHRGRLWAICPHCERWSLSPIHERWEAIEEAERQFEGATRRASTDNIGLARVADGTSLIRIGKPQRPEFAAWRYGDQFGRRRRRQVAWTVAGLAGMGAVYWGGPALGLYASSAVGGFGWIIQAGTLWDLRRRVVARVQSAESAEPLRLTKTNARCARIVEDDAHGWALTFSHRALGGGLRWNSVIGMHDDGPVVRLAGEPARHAVSMMLPHVNAFAGSSRTVQAAVGLVESAGVSQVFERAARNTEWTGLDFGMGRVAPGSLAALPAPMRLALEMASHEESERRALEGELAELERAWKDAEEIAAIADDL